MSTGLTLETKIHMSRPIALPPHGTSRGKDADDGCPPPMPVEAMPTAQRRRELRMLWHDLAMSPAQHENAEHCQALEQQSWR